MASTPSGTRQRRVIDECYVCDLKFKDEQQLRWHLAEEHELSFKPLPIEEQDSAAGRIKLLKKILKENISEYLEKLLLWIRCDITRSEFDFAVRPLFTPETIVIHNEFLISFLQQIRSMTRDSKVWTKPTSLQNNLAKKQKAFLPGSSFDVTNNNRILSVGHMGLSLKEALPDQETVYALAVVSAWEKECALVNKKIVPLLSNAVETVVRNIIMAIMVRRKVRADEFVYDVGKPFPSSIEPEEMSQYTSSITLTELLDTLEAEPDLIPMKSVYKLTMQRILTSLEKKKVKSENIKVENT